jgi:hypothetical protein
MEMKMKKLLLLLLIIAVTDSIAQLKENKNKNLSSENGRFVFGQISEYRRDQYLLDTQTGRIWQIVADSSKNVSLQQILFESIDGSKTLLPEEPSEQLKRFFEKVKKSDVDVNGKNNK